MKRKTAADCDEATDPADIVWLSKLLRAEKREDAAWRRLAEVLQAACSDPIIAPSRGAGFFASAVGSAAQSAAAARPEVVGDIDAFSAEAWRRLDAHLSSVRAERRGAKPREWVREQWALQKADCDGNKSRFATDYGTPDRAPRGAERGLVWNKFKVRVMCRQIRERWLKGC